MNEQIERVVVVGMGQIGLPTAAVIASSGLRVIGVDRDSERIENLRNGTIPFDEPGLRELFAKVVGSNHLSFSTDCPEADVYLICVPATGNLKSLMKAVETVGSRMHAGALVLIESTMPPGTTMGKLLPALTEIGWDPGVDFALAHAPERVAPGRILDEIVSLDRLIGGLTGHCSDRASSFYRHFVEGNLHVTDVTTAELVKVTENAFRDVNVAFANEVATVALQTGANPFELIRLANTHPRVDIHRPGLGAGGHCLPASSRAFAAAGAGHAHLTATARELSAAAPSVMHARIREIVASADRPVQLAFFGFAYKPDVDDLRGSPGLELFRRLRDDKDFEIRAYDPHLVDDDLVELDEALTGADLVVVGCGHTAFGELDAEHAAGLVRTKRIFDPTGTINYRRWRENGFHVIRR